MNRRALLAGLTAALVRQSAVHAEHDPFPLAPKPNPNITCAAPFVRKREEVDPTQFLNDLKVWAIDNAYLRQSYVFLNPALAPLLPAGGEITLNRTAFHIKVMEPGVMGPDELWGIMADCGALL